MEATKLSKSLGSELRFSRRHFLQNSLLSVAALSVPWAPVEEFSQQIPLKGLSSVRLNSNGQQANVVIYQDQAHFDVSGNLPAYEPPRNLSSSTRDYVNSLDSVSYLSRHWFA